MSQHTFSWELFSKAPIVGIIRGLSAEDIDHILPVYREAGLTTIEITMNTAGAATIIQNAIKYHNEGLNIGAGTVCTLDDLDQALDAGAQFIVTPIIDKKVIKTCVKRGVPIFPVLSRHPRFIKPGHSARRWLKSIRPRHLVPSTLRM